MSRRNQERRSAFGGSVDPQQAADEIYGTADAFANVGGQTIRAKALPLREITADITQPRHLAPRRVRGNWQGEPDNVGRILLAWANSLEIGHETIRKAVSGESSIFDEMPDNGLTKIVQLAADIHRIGLQSPIRVRKGDNGYVIVYGERRWWAHHLLDMMTDDDYSRIPAIVSDKSEWEIATAQASENNANEGLNAIGRARQFAKLLMVARDDGYLAYEECIAPGDCDRLYFAQVADGNTHRIPRGMGSEFEAALGVSTGQMRQYRALLALTNDSHVNNQLWDIADERDWSENFLRNISSTLSAREIAQIFDKVRPEHYEDEFRDMMAWVKDEQDTVTPVTVADDEDTVTTVTVDPDHVWRSGDKVMYRGERYVVDSDDGQVLLVDTDDEQQARVWITEDKRREVTRYMPESDLSRRHQGGEVLPKGRTDEERARLNASAEEYRVQREAQREQLSRDRDEFNQRQAEREAAAVGRDNVPSMDVNPDEALAKALDHLIAINANAIGGANPNSLRALANMARTPQDSRQYDLNFIDRYLEAYDGVLEALSNRLEAHLRAMMGMSDD